MSESSIIHDKLCFLNLDLIMKSILCYFFLKTFFLREKALTSCLWLAGGIDLWLIFIQA